MKDNKFRKRLKRLRIFAYVSSSMLTVFILWQSVLNAAASGENSRNITNIIKELFDIDDTIEIQNIEINDKSIEDKFCFSGDTFKIPLTVSPANASQDITYTVTSQSGEPIDGCTVDKNGNLTYVNPNCGYVRVTAASTRDPDINDTADIYFRGISPIDESVEAVRIRFYDDGKVNEYSPSELKVGMKYYMLPSLIIKDEYLGIYGLDSKELITDGLLYKLTDSSEASETLYGVDMDMKSITFYREFDGELKFSYRKDPTVLFEQSTDDQRASTEVSVSVSIDPSYDYAPKKAYPLCTDDLENDGVKYTKISNTEYIITVPPHVKDIELYSEKGDDSVNIIGNLVYADEASRSTASIKNLSELRRTANRGECNLYLEYLLNKDIRIKIKVIYEPQELDNNIKVIGKGTVHLGSDTKYGVSFNNEVYDEQEVYWSIVKGASIATIEDGMLKTTGVGNVVIRATSAHDSEAYNDFTVKVRLWEDFSGFIRKLVGHMLMFFLLGEGYLVSFFFLFKRRRILSFIISPAALFLMAYLSEYLQSQADGRHYSVADIILNSVSSVMGMSFVIICIVSYLLILTVVSFRSIKDIGEALNEQ